VGWQESTASQKATARLLCGCAHELQACVIQLTKTLPLAAPSSMSAGEPPTLRISAIGNQCPKIALATEMQIAVYDDAVTTTASSSWTPQRGNERFRTATFSLNGNPFLTATAGVVLVLNSTAGDVMKFSKVPEDYPDAYRSNGKVRVGGHDLMEPQCLWQTTTGQHRSTFCVAKAGTGKWQRFNGGTDQGLTWTGQGICAGGYPCTQSATEIMEISMK